MKKTNPWLFDKVNQYLWNPGGQSETATYESQFKFPLTREKNMMTYEEKLIIECLRDGNKNGMVITDLINIEKDMKQFLKYGVAFSAPVFSDIVQAIKNEYGNIKVREEITNSKMVDEKVISGVLELVKEYREEEVEKNDEILFGVDEFEELLKETDFEEYDVREIRKALADGGYLVTKGNRTSKLKKINGKPVRVISFLSKKLK